ncbi:MAG: hypothetical protein OER88_06745, partial [Planctomycetota bacterium]|nr:hypothetical protein [Planctomycetota bacterium]
MARFCGLASARANPDRAAAMANALQSGTSVQLSTGAAERLTFAAGTTMGSLPAAVTSTDERTGRVALFAGYLLERPAGENHAEMLLSCCEDDACLAALNGIFAAAVWDPRDDTLVLVTDRWGMRPLYWAHVEDGIAFGSSIRSVVAAGVDADLDVHALEETLGAGFALGQRTLWSAVRRVEPATRLTMRGRSVGTTHYWRWPAAGDERVEDVGFVEGAAAIFRNTIDELARRTERPVCLLSAGYDSRRIVLALAGAGANAEAYTASAPFAQRYTIDVPVAVEVCRRLGLSITTTPLPTPHETDRMAEAAGALLDYETEEGVLLMP